jgi:hypothetical protein
VQIYDLEEETWYNQTTTGNVTSRTQFCAAVVNDPDSWSYQIFVIGGADFESKDIVTEMYVIRFHKSVILTIAVRI